MSLSGWNSSPTSTRAAYALTLAAGELSEAERNAAALAVPSAARADDIEMRCGDPTLERWVPARKNDVVRLGTC